MMTIRLRTYQVLFLILTGLIFFPPVLQAQQKEMKVLFVGNSYTYGNNLAHIVSILSDSTETKLITRKSVIGGAYLREHWNGDRELKTREVIAEGDFDIVVPQFQPEIDAMYLCKIHYRGAAITCTQNFHDRRCRRRNPSIDGSRSP
jgi:hypothetical protein